MPQGKQIVGRAGFPFVTGAMRTARIGVDLVSSIVHDEWNWIFRRNSGDTDLGIDGYVDVVNDEGAATGQCLAVQVKTGVSYFSRATEGGFIFRGERKHLNYYMNCPVLVVIILCNPDTKQCFWVPFSAGKTDRIASGWKIIVPRNSVLCRTTKSELLKIVGPARDFLPELESYWALNEVLATRDYVHYAIDRSTIEDGNVGLIAEFFGRIRDNDDLCRRFQGRIELSITGYEEDEREVYQREEVRAWFGEADGVVRDWFFFLDPTPPAFALRLYLLCFCSESPVSSGEGRTIVPVDGGCLAMLLARNWPRLNKMTERLGLSEEENARIAYAVMDAWEVPHGDS